MSVALGGVTSSGLKSADSQICARECYLHSIIIGAPSAGTATMVIYDSENNTTSGKVELFYHVSSSTSESQTIHFTNPVNCSKGIYVDITGTDLEYIIHYSV